MTTSRPLRPWRDAPLALLLLTMLTLGACGEGRDDAANAPPEPETQPEAVEHPLLGVQGAMTIEDAGADLAPQLVALKDASTDAPTAGLVVDYPFDGTVFPPDFVPPTFLWHDEDSGADTWLVEVRHKGASDPELTLLLAGVPPPKRPVDKRALGPTNEVYQPTPYQASAHSWTPEPAIWASIQKHAMGGASVRLVGFASASADRPLSAGTVRIETSVDPVEAPIFYRDVPLMPVMGEKGKIQPLPREGLPLIEWRLKDVTKPGSRLLMTGLSSCTNCHSLSKDGSTLGMDVDGPDGDKGTYAIVPVSPEMIIDYDQVISWNDFEDTPEFQKTIGFLSRMSPNGRYAVTTLNEDVYVSNFMDYQFLQVFFPTRGILAWYDTKTQEMKALPGADDPGFVHCNPVWTPDGKEIVFCRAAAQDAYVADRPMAAKANDPNEAQVKYDLYRMPFNDGKGGTPTPIAGASDNGVSNTFPKVSPDGRWIVYTRCKNGLLMRPDGKLCIVPLGGGEARELECNLPLMNSWHSFSPNGRWLVWSSKSFTPYTQMFLTHLDEDGHASPAVLVPDATADNRAVNIPEFLNKPFDALQSIDMPALAHKREHHVGTALLKQGRPLEALPHLRKAVELDPEFCRARVNLAFALMATGRREEAFQHFEEAVRINPSDHFALANMGIALFQTGRLEEALEASLLALEINPDMPAANNTVGQSLLRQQKYEEALPYLRKAAAAEPPIWPARRNLGLLLMQLGKLEEGIRIVEEVLQAHPEDAHLRQALGQARSELQRR